MDFDDSVDGMNLLKEMFWQYCEPRKNITYPRHLFFTRAKSKTTDAYVTVLKNKAKEKLTVTSKRPHYVWC